MQKCNDIRFILSDVKPSDVIVTDLDNVVLTSPHHHLARDEWSARQLDKLVEQGLSKEKATDESTKRFNQIQKHVKGHAAHPEARLADKIKALIDTGVTVMGLTARTFDIAPHTLSQLKDINFRFSAHLEAGEFEYDGKKVISQDGVVFCHDRDKGVCLLKAFEFLSQPLQPHQRVIFIDDKLENCHHVGRSLADREIDYHVWHYDYVEKASPFNDTALAISEIQHHVLSTEGILIDNQEAHQRLPREVPALAST